MFGVLAPRAPLGLPDQTFRDRITSTECLILATTIWLFYLANQAPESSTYSKLGIPISFLLSIEGEGTENNG
jgi:hypothetical protein